MNILQTDRLLIRYISTNQPSFNGQYSWTRWASRYQNFNAIWILLQQEVIEVAVYRTEFMCKSDHHQPTYSTYIQSLQAGCPSCRPTNSVKAPKAKFAKRDRDCAAQTTINRQHATTAGRSGLAVAYLTAVREVLGSNRAVGSCLSHNHCDLQPWARAVCTFPAVLR